MRPSVDLAYRARNWFWFWRVRGISGLSNDLLDRKCFGELGRRRHFERIQVSASSPDEIPLVDGKTLLDLVDRWDWPSKTEPGPYTTATHEFNSRLWYFLANRDLPPSSYTDYIDQFANNHGWTRIASKDRGIYILFLGENEPAVEGGVSMSYSAMLHKLVNESTPDSIAMLIALFKEAMDRVDLEQAIAIRLALRASIYWIGESTGMNKLTISLIMQLVNDRVLRNQWFVESDWKNQAKISTPSKSSRGRVREFQAFIKWYIDPKNKQADKIYGEYPFVPQSERTDWFETNRDYLYAAMKQINYLRTMRSQLCESESSDCNKIAENFRIAENELLAQIQAPNSEPEGFYTSRPDLILNKLPCPYPAIKTSEHTPK